MQVTEVGIKHKHEAQRGHCFQVARPMKSSSIHVW